MDQMLEISHVRGEVIADAGEALHCTAMRYSTLPAHRVLNLLSHDKIGGQKPMRVLLNFPRRAAGHWSVSLARVAECEARPLGFLPYHPGLLNHRYVPARYPLPLEAPERVLSKYLPA